MLAKAIFGSSGFVIVGLLRDTTGSYVASFHFLGAMALIGGLLFAGFCGGSFCFMSWCF